MSFICHIHNYTEYNQQWNVFSAFNPSKYILKYIQIENICLKKKKKNVTVFDW